MAQKTSDAARRLDQIVNQLRDTSVPFAKADDVGARKNLNSKSILVTGGASGLGEAFVRRFAELGAFVLIADVDARRGVALENELLAKGRSVKFVQCDVCSWDSQVAAFKQAIASSPKRSLDHVMVNAGVRGNILRRKKGVTKHDEPQKPALGSIDVNVMGGYYTSELALHYMKDSDEPRAKDARCPKSILFIGSMASYRALVFATDYTAAKFAVRGMFKSLRGAPGAAWGVRVNMLAPAYLLTPMTETRAKSIASLGFEFTDLRVVEDAAIRLMGDENMTGRSIADTTDGAQDLNDDFAGLDGWPMQEQLMRRGLHPVNDGS